MAAAATVGMMAASSEAGASLNATDLSANLVTSSGGFTNMMAMLGYVGGFGLAIAGIFKLKDHVDNPGQTKMKDGVMRLAAGGALLTLPYIANVMQGSVGNNGAAVTGQTIVAAP